MRTNETAIGKGGVSKEEIYSCYISILGREPESDHAIEHHLTAENLQTLISRFITSQEFRKRTAARQKYMATDLAALAIDLIVIEDELNSCVERIRRAWTHLGQTRPHHSVLSNPVYLPRQIDRHVDKFWRSGQVEGKIISNRLKRYGLRDISSRTCVEYGCGMGRVTVQLAGIFHDVFVYDISEPHLELANSKAQELGITNITFNCLANDVLSPLEKSDPKYRS